VGTRDLLFKMAENNWLNVGDSMARSYDSVPPAQQVYESIATEPGVIGESGNAFRQQTEVLLKNWDKFGDRLMPVMLGGVIEKNTEVLERVYLIATDQTQAIERFQNSDTCHAADLIKRWVETRYPIPCEIMFLGQAGENPTDFDAMVQWSKQQVWATVRAFVEQQDEAIERILIALKGGVGQCSEALRVTALTGFVEQELQFYDFTENLEENKKGNFSQHHLSSGNYYLWELAQRQSIALLERYDYAGAENLLDAKLKVESNSEVDKIRKLLKSLKLWNQADFSSFYKELENAKSVGISINGVQPSKDWWRNSYESAYLGTVRLKQGHTVEALLHTFRAIEGMVIEWIRANYQQHLKEEAGKAIEILPSILKEHPSYEWKFQRIGEGRQLRLYSDAGYELLRVARPASTTCGSMNQFFGEVKELRDQSMHQVVGMDDKRIFKAWGVKDEIAWQKRVLDCLNFVSDKDFSSLKKASVMPIIHASLIDAIQAYHP
jgi:hypothetical protein